MKNIRRSLWMVLALWAMAILAGCGSGTEKTQEAMALIENLDYQSALTVFKEAAEAGEDRRMIDRGMGIAYLCLARYEEAQESFLLALGSSNGIVQNVDFDLNYYLAGAYRGAGKFEEARKVYDSILALRPKEQDAYFLRGSVAMELNDYSAAKEDFDRVVAMDPKNYDRLFAIYEIFDRFGYKTAGQEYLLRALSEGEKTLSSFDRGRIYFFLEDYQKAYVELEDAKGDYSAESSLYLGKAYEATGDYNYACNVYRSYLEKQGDSAEMYNQLGVCEMKRRNYDAAREAFQAGLALQNKEMHQTLSYNEIVAYEFLGDFQKAGQLMQDYLKNYPDDEKAVRENVFLNGERSSGDEEAI